MNILVNQNKLLSALRTVERIVSKNPSLPILNSVLLKTDNGRLRISATNLELGMNYWISAKVEEEGEIAIPAKVFSDFISNINTEKIQMRVEKNVLLLDSEKYKTRILGMEASDFPIIPPNRTTASVVIKNSLLKDALVNVVDATSLSETRPELNGVFVSINEHKASFAATDGSRLSEKVITLESEFTKSFILPRVTALEIIRIVDNLDSDVGISLSENQIFVFNDHFQLVSRLVDGHYPEYKRIIPTNFSSTVKINKQEFDKNIRLASIFSSNISDITLKASEGVMELVAKNSDRGEITASVTCVLEGESFEIALNYHYLLDGLKTFSVNDLTLGYTGDVSPFMIHAEQQKDQVYIIMPLRN